MSDILDLLVPNASWRDGPCAEVRVGDHVIRYVRWGSGPPVVVFGVDGGRNPMWGSLLEQLARSHRLVIPQMPPIGINVSGWLRGFIEGIGLAPIVLLAGGPSAAAALELAALDDITVRKLILVGAVMHAPSAGSRLLGMNNAFRLHQRPARATSDQLRL